ncbi:hypothetical protein MRX96_047097 [Rhipicephalus microplus]
MAEGESCCFGWEECAATRLSALSSSGTLRPQARNADEAITSASLALSVPAPSNAEGEPARKEMQVTASSTGPFPGAASAHPVAFMDARFSQAMRSPDFPACRPCGLRVRECLPVLDPPTAVSFDGRINWQLYKKLDLRPPLW